MVNYFNFSRENLILTFQQGQRSWHLLISDYIYFSHPPGVLFYGAQAKVDLFKIFKASWIRPFVAARF